MSDILRLLTTCSGPMYLMDHLGHIMHINKHWSELCGYNMNDIESAGATDSLLHGPLTNKTEIEDSKLKLQQGIPIKLNDSLYYRKNGSTFRNDVAFVPIRGRQNSSEITHYCGYLEARV